jgi:flagellar biosynthesis/type III secretory pathway protein FliH
MRNNRSIRTTILSSIVGAVLVAIFAINASAQNTNAEYRQWQVAQQRAEREHQEYLRTRSQRDYRQWQNAMATAQREYADYQRATTYGRRDNNPWNDNNGNRRYRVNRNGSYYETDNRGAELLRQAVRNGYAQGYQRGQIDRQNRGRYDYFGNSTYRSGDYGYQTYVARNQYQYYFQQGFQRGYEDGYYSRTQYGTRSGATISILGSVLNTILNITNMPP